MPKNIRWKIPLIAIAIAIALFALYPPFEKPIKKERIKEINGKVVQKETIEKKWVALFVKNPIVNETILNKTIDESGAETVEKIVEYRARGQVKLGLDLRGGSELLYKVLVREKEDRLGITKDVIEVLKKRIDPKGIMEYRIQEQGSHRILIQVPGAVKSDIESLKQRLTRLGKLEFRLAAPKESSEYIEASEGKKVAGYYKHWLRKAKGEEDKTGEWILVRNKVEITGEHLAKVFPDRKDIQPVVGFEFDQIGKAKFGQLTERNIGKPLAIILDDILYSAPIIRDRIPGKGIIEGNFTQEEVNDLIAVMRAGSLPADLALEMETTVGPSLGRDSINQGLRAGLIGSIFVLLFMGIYYLGAGWVANLAVALNTLFIVGVMAIIKATMTMPGLAGLVLTIGMAVDANVLIFERIREEKDKGRPIKLAIKNGYEIAFRTIFDANLTTLITAVILAAVGTGPVKGFAWVLIIGMVLNMFTAIFVTRTIFDIFLAKQWTKNLAMLRFFSKTQFPFVSFSNITIPISIILIIGGLTAFTIKGSGNYDIDFTGGTLAHLQLKDPTSVGFVRKSLAKNGYPNAEVQGIWAGGDILTKDIDPTEFGIRIKGLNEEKIQEKIANDIKKSFANLSLDGKVAFNKTTEFNISVERPIEEDIVQKCLLNIGYSSKDIISVEPSGPASKNFEIILPAIDDEKEQYNTLKAISDGLKDHLLSSQVEISFGEIVESSAPGGFNNEPYKDHLYSLPLDLNKEADPALIQMELNNAGFKEITISKYSAERKTSTTRFEIKGPKGTLQEIKEKMTRSIPIPSLIFADNSTIRIGLKETVTEETLRKLFVNIPGLNESIERLSSPDTKAGEFLVKMHPISTAKIQEKIQDDITEIFKNNIYIDKIGVTFSQDANLLVENKNNSSISNPDIITNSGVQELTMRLDVPLGKEKIERALTEAGYANSLVQVLEEDKNYDAVKLKYSNESERETMKEKIKNAFVIPSPLKRIVSIGATVAGEMKNRAILALIFACFAIIVYIWYRFGEFKFGAAAVIALIHDVLITLGAVAVADYFGDIFGDMKLNLPMVAAFLTLVGYSLNDTIVVFDRIRENMGGKKRVLDQKLVDESINQTLGRTIITSLTTFGVLVSLYFIGGPEIHGFAFVMGIGVIVGTYSSIYIASPILIKWSKK